MVNAILRLLLCLLLSPEARAAFYRNGTATIYNSFTVSNTEGISAADLDRRQGDSYISQERYQFQLMYDKFIELLFAGYSNFDDLSISLNRTVESWVSFRNSSHSARIVAFEDLPCPIITKAQDPMVGKGLSLLKAYAEIPVRFDRIGPRYMHGGNIWGGKYEDVQEYEAIRREVQDYYQNLTKLHMVPPAIPNLLDQAKENDSILQVYGPTSEIEVCSSPPPTSAPTNSPDPPERTFRGPFILLTCLFLGFIAFGAFVGRHESRRTSPRPPDSNEQPLGDSMEESEAAVLGIGADYVIPQEAASKRKEKDRDLAPQSTSNTIPKQTVSKGMLDGQDLDLEGTDYTVPLQEAGKELQDDKYYVLVACKRNGDSLRFASDRMRNDKTVVFAACTNDGNALQYASESLQGNKEVVFIAFKENSKSIQFARGISAEELQHDEDFLLVATEKFMTIHRGQMLAAESSDEDTWNSKSHVMRACSEQGSALQFASADLQDNKAVVMQACSQDSSALQFASPGLRGNKDVVLKACTKSGDALLYASWELRRDMEFMVLACKQNIDSLKYARPKLLNDRDFARKICAQNGRALKYLPQQLQNDREVVLAACSKDCVALQFASSTLRSDKEVVLAAVQSKPEALKFALNGLNQDKDCLVKARLWDEDHAERNLVQGTKKVKIVLSTKFSLAARSSDHATRFTLGLKQHPYIANENFVVYSPNAFNKSTCDPQWTNQAWPCRGTLSCCERPSRTSAGVPIEADCCWRFSFKYHLQEANELDGFMIQVADWDTVLGKHTLGDGQGIETEMAKDTGTKVFRFYEPLYAYSSQLDKLVSEIKSWYENKCSDMAECNVRMSKS